MNEVIGCGSTKRGSIEALLVRLGEEGEVCCCSASINTFYKYCSSETAH